MELVWQVRADERIVQNWPRPAILVEIIGRLGWRLVRESSEHLRQSMVPVLDQRPQVFHAILVCRFRDPRRDRGKQQKVSTVHVLVEVLRTGGLRDCPCRVAAVCLGCEVPLDCPTFAQSAS